MTAIVAVPRHIAFIMDGNGRWAKKRMMPRNFGHRAGADNLMTIAKACSAMGIGFMSVYAFSTENWARSEDEVSGLMRLAVEFFSRELKELAKSDVKIRFMGDLSALPEDTRRACENLAEMSAGRKGMVLNIGLNYGGRAEIARAARILARKAAEGSISASDIDEEMVSAHLYTAGQPDVDLLIRTGCESRLSGFMLYQSSYAEFLVSDTLWPDFSESELKELIKKYTEKERRFGGVPPREENC